ncbi:hypothetical protein EUGRSUZ_C01989 [Eucalyptus grandis]|uniref:Uncharacterized protein n=2 Tax=Eucalyptus grandis TaxID=71139 RepID=A0ACC3LEM8_EUCGR|nr:hypothetical protein EUGRSUZ_C01989 [Eucalyptus grandis]
MELFCILFITFSISTYFVAHSLGNTFLAYAFLLTWCVCLLEVCVYVKLVYLKNFSQVYFEFILDRLMSSRW